MGTGRLDYWFAHLLALVANMMRGKDQAPVKPEDFIAWLSQQTPETEAASDDQAIFEELLLANFGDE